MSDRSYEEMSKLFYLMKTNVLKFFENKKRLMVCTAFFDLIIISDFIHSINSRFIKLTEVEFSTNNTLSELASTSFLFSARNVVFLIFLSSTAVDTAVLRLT